MNLTLTVDSDDYRSGIGLRKKCVASGCQQFQVSSATCRQASGRNLATNIGRHSNGDRGVGGGSSWRLKLRKWKYGSRIFIGTTLGRRVQEDVWKEEVRNGGKLERRLQQKREVNILYILKVKIPTGIL